MPIQREITEHTLFKRVKKAMLEPEASDGGVLMLCRCAYKSKWYGELGRYYVTDSNQRWIKAQHQDVEALAQYYGVLGAHETVIQEIDTSYR